MGAFLGALENVGAPLPPCQRLGPAPAPDDLIVGSAGSTGEVEAISIPSTSPPPIARLKPLGVASVVPVTSSTAICSGLPVHRGRAHPLSMGTKSRETIYGGSVRAAAERATEARKEADRLACEAWNKRMLGFQGPAQPSPALGDAINAGFGYLEVKCLAATRTRPLPSTSCGDRRQRRSMNSNATCGARTAPKSGAILQAEPSGGAAHHQDHGERSAIDMVAGGAMI